MRAELIFLPVVWLIAVMLAVASLPVWHLMVASLSQISPNLTPLLGNPVVDVLWQFILPSLMVAIGAYCSLKS